MLGRALVRFVVVAAAVAALVGVSGAAEEPAKRPNCAFVELQGFSYVDDHTAVLEYGHRTGAPAHLRLWFKVTFANSCPRLKQARIVDMKTRDCPKHGDVLKFSRSALAEDDEIDSCMIDSAEEIPVGSTVLPKLN